MIRAGRTIAVSMIALILSASASPGDMVIGEHQGANNPTSEGFTYGASFGSATTGPVANAWNITAGSTSTQVGYSQNLTTTQDQEVASQGFTFSLLASVTQANPQDYSGKFSPASDSGVDFGTSRRFDITLALNSSGDTEVVLATSYGGGDNYYVAGPSYTLTGSGTSYNLFQLVYNATTQTADLYVNGVDVIQGYQGETQYYNSGAFGFGADNGGSANFEMVSLALGDSVAVPEPSTIVLGSIGGLIGLLLGRRRRRPIA